MTDANYTHLALIVDRSGSMSPIAGDMNGAIRELLKEQAKEPGDLLIDITTFDQEIELPYLNAKAEDITEDVIMPRGMTALLDAIGITITGLGTKLRVLPEKDRPGKVIVVVVTDGYENASQEYTREQVKKMVEEQTDKWGWTFMYLAANVDAFATGGGMGFRTGQTMSYAATGQTVSAGYGGLHANISRSRAGDESGFTADEREAAVSE